MSASALHSDALARYQNGQYPEAALLFEQAAAAYRADGERALSAEMLNNLGVVYRAQKNYPAALTIIESALADFRALDDPPRIALALGNLGSVLLETGRLDRAAAVLIESFELLDPRTDKAPRSEILRVLGEVRLKQAKLVEGLADYDAGLRDVDTPNAQQRWLRKLLDVAVRMMGRKQ